MVGIRSFPFRGEPLVSGRVVAGLLFLGLMARNSWQANASCFQFHISDISARPVALFQTKYVLSKDDNWMTNCETKSIGF